MLILVAGIYENWVFFDLRPLQKGGIWHCISCASVSSNVSNEQDLHTSHIHFVTKHFLETHSVLWASASSALSNEQELLNLHIRLLAFLFWYLSYSCLFLYFCAASSTVSNSASSAWTNCLLLVLNFLSWASSSWLASLFSCFWARMKVQFAANISNTPSFSSDAMPLVPST